MSGPLLSTLIELLEAQGIDLAAWGLAWARVLPTVMLVPAFGLRALPGPARVVLGLSLALTVAPAFVALNPDQPWVLQLLHQAALGVPIALGAAATLWAATQAGGLVDNLRGGQENVRLPNLEGSTTPAGAILGMLASLAFLEGGGAARVVTALMRTDVDLAGAWSRAAVALLGSVELAIAVAAPVVAAAIVLEVASALVARAASPAFVQPLLAPLKSLLVLGVFALVLERITELIALGAAYSGTR